MLKKASKKTVKTATKKVATKKDSQKTVPKITEKHVCRIVKNDPAREERIDMEIVVDAHDSEERAMGWHCSIEDTVENNVRCRCRKTRSMSPLKVGEEVDVLDVAPADDCESEISFSCNGTTENWPSRWNNWSRLKAIRKPLRSSKTGSIGA